MFENFFKELIYSVNPAQYKTLGYYDCSRAFYFVSKIVFVSFCVLSIVLLPTILDIPQYFSKKISALQSFNVNTSINMSGPVFLPDKDFLLTIDTTGNITKLKKGLILVTNDDLQYKLFGKVSKFRYNDEFVENKKEFVKFLAFVSTILTLPLIISLYFVFLIKYFIIGLVFSIVLFLLIDLTSFTLSFKRVFNTCMYSLVLVIPLEMFSSAIDTNYLIPFFRTYLINFYTIPLTIYLIFVLVSLGFIVAHQKSKISVEW